MDAVSQAIFSYLLAVLRDSKTPIQDGYEAVLKPYTKHFKVANITHIVRYAVMYYRYNNAKIASNTTLAELNAQKDRASC